MTPAEVIKKRIELRAYIEQQEMAFAEQMKPYHDATLALDGWMLKHFNENNEQSVKTEFGTAYKSVTLHAKVVDRNTFLTYVIENWENGTEAFLTSAVSKEAVKDFVEKHQSPPPGVDIAYVSKANFRKA